MRLVDETRYRRRGFNSTQRRRDKFRRTNANTRVQSLGGCSRANKGNKIRDLSIARTVASVLSVTASFLVHSLSLSLYSARVPSGRGNRNFFRQQRLIFPRKSLSCSRYERKNETRGGVLDPGAALDDDNTSPGCACILISSRGQKRWTRKPERIPPVCHRSGPSFARLETFRPALVLRGRAIVSRIVARELLYRFAVEHVPPTPSSIFRSTLISPTR